MANLTGKKFGGRKPGSTNKVTAELRTRIKTFLDDHWHEIEKDFRSLEPKDRLNFIEKLLPYAAPKLRESDLKVNFSELSAEELDSVINRMLDSYEK